MPISNNKERVWVNPDMKKFLKNKALEKNKNLLDLKPFDLDSSLIPFDYNINNDKKRTKQPFKFRL